MSQSVSIWDPCSTYVLLLKVLAPQKEGSATINWTRGLKMKQKVTGGSLQEFSDTEADGVRAPAKGDSVSR